MDNNKRKASMIKKTRPNKKQVLEWLRCNNYRELEANAIDIVDWLSENVVHAEDKEDKEQPTQPTSTAQTNTILISDFQVTSNVESLRTLEKTMDRLVKKHGEFEKFRRAYKNIGKTIYD